MTIKTKAWGALCALALSAPAMAATCSSAKDWGNLGPPGLEVFGHAFGSTGSYLDCSTFTLTVNLDPAATPAPPPQNAPVNSVTIGATAGTSRVHVSPTQVTASFTIPAGAATGPQTVTVVFPGPPTDPTATVTYTLANGFTVN